MQTVSYIVFYVALAVAAGPARASHQAGVAAGEPGRDLTPAEAARVMNFVYEGKTRLAIDYLQEVSAACAGQPFYLLVKTRVGRELLTVDDENKDQVKADAEPIHRDLDRVIETCSRRMEAGDQDPKLRLYRGLAWMSKSHLNSFAREFWSAGRDAKKGKSDLEAYLEIHPDDPVAKGTLGVFLYFADTIPSVFKFVSKLLLLPTGDREEGLRYLAFAAGRPSFLQTEFEVVLSTIHLLFEGRFEDGIEGTIDLARRYPSNPRVALPLALVLPFDPADIERNDRLVEETLDRLADLPGGEPEHYTLTLLEFLHAHASRFIVGPDVAQARLGRIADENPRHPDWVGGYAAFELGRLQASLGLSDEARTAFDWVTHNRRVGYLHDDARELSSALGDIDRAANIPNTMWLAEIYFGTPGDRRNAIEGLAASAATPPADFYMAEALLLSGDLDAALASYQRVVSAEVDPWNKEFQMLAAGRIAEIHGALGAYGEASDWLEKAMDFYQKEFLVDWLLEGRKRYYERLRDGETEETPRLLTAIP